MHTVLGSMASTLGVLALVGVFLSVLIAFAGPRFGAPRGQNSAAVKAVDDARALLAAGQPAQGGAAPARANQQHGPAFAEAGPAMELPVFDADILDRYKPRPKWWSQRPWILPAIAGAAGLLLSLIIGTQLLYVPMVSAAYRQLYHAYCQVDGVAEILSRRVVDRDIAAIAQSDACLPPPVEAAPGQADKAAKAGSVTSAASQPVALTQDDVFFLLNALGLLDPREKSKAELFREGDNPTKNHELATWLADPKVYVVGTPTSLLLLRIAGNVGSGFAVEVHCPTSGSSTVEATQIGFKAAVLSAVLAQQPAPGHAGWTLGSALLGANGPVAIDEIVPFDQASCDGDKALAAVDLGPNFGGSAFGWRSPLLERPARRLTDAQIIGLVLGWAGWKPATVAQKVASQDAAIAFMEAMTSEAGGTAKVSDAKIAVNFFIGWERLAILCIVPFLGLCLLWQQVLNTDDARHLRDIKQTIAATARDRQLRDLSLSILARRLYRSVGRSAPREILVAALEVHAQIRGASSPVDFDRVHRVAEHEMRIMDRSRFFFLAGLPLLPTIGFVGTVRSLIEALALADRIPRATTAIEQVAAVSDVTSTLSLCFSTTFMALGALLVFAPLDLWQATSERHVVEEAERLLDPGL